MAQDLIIRPRLCKFDRTLRPIDRRVDLVRFEIEIRAIAIGHRQLWVGRQRFERLDRIDRVLAGRFAMAREPAQAGQPAQRPAFLDALARGAPGFQGRASSFDGELILSREVILVRQLLLQAGAIRREQNIRVAQCNLVMRCRFAMSPHRRCLRGGQGSKSKHIGAIARAVGVKSEAGRGDIGPIRQNGEHLVVQELQARPRKRALDRKPGQFMPIGERAVLIAHHADAQTPLDTLLRGPDRLLE